VQTGEQPDHSREGIKADDLQALARSVRSSFAGESDLFSALDALIARLNKPFDEIGKSLRANISGLLATISVPYTLAQTSMMGRHFQRFHMAARIRLLEVKYPGDPPEAPDAGRDAEREHEALAKANAHMDRFANSDEGRGLLIRDTLGFLEGLRANASIGVAANEMLLQGAVLCWGAFEVLGRDCFVERLNSNPSLALRLLADPVAKRRFELSKISLETFAAHGFDLSGRMGTLLAQQQDLSDIYSIKSVYHALFPDRDSLRDSLSDPDLRSLSLRRNLIVHRRGIIDETYASSMKISRCVGDRLALCPDDLEVHLNTVLRSAVSILEAVSGP
jgi:hypothetical protein